MLLSKNGMNTNNEYDNTLAKNAPPVLGGFTKQTGEGNAPRRDVPETESELEREWSDAYTDGSASLQDYKDELNRRIESDAHAFSQLAKALDTVTAQRDELLAALKGIEQWAESRDGSPESDEKALSEISEIAAQAQLKAEGRAQ